MMLGSLCVKIVCAVFYFDNVHTIHPKLKFSKPCQTVISYTTVTLPKPTVGRRSASKILENRPTSAVCRPTSAPILAEFVVGRLFCRSTLVKSFVDRSTDFHRFCHR